MEPVPRNLKILSGITIALFVIALYMVFFYAPREAVMGGRVGRSSHLSRCQCRGRRYIAGQ